MSEKKVVSRNVAIALGITSVILLVGLVAAVVNYTMVVGDKDDTIQVYSDQKTQLFSEKTKLQTWLDGNTTLLNQTERCLQGNITYYNALVNSLNSEIATLENQRNELQAWLANNVTDYETQISSLNSQISSLTSHITQLQTWLNGNITYYNSLVNTLQSQVASLNAQITSLNSQITNLQNQINALKAPKLIKVDLEADDNRPWLQTPYLHVYGYVCNVGTNIAYNCKLHAIAYQGGVVAIDTYITLGTVSGESWRSVDSAIYYTGSALTSWTVTPEWTT